MNFVDTHAHIQMSNYKLNPDEVWLEAKQKGVTRVLLVGEDLDSSQQAIDYARGKDGLYATIGVHPHHAKKFLETNDAKEKLEKLLQNKSKDKVVAIGEFGLDYYYENSPKKYQIELLKYHLALAQKHDLPCCFHVRDAFDDFWPVFDEFNAKKPIKGVVHCFTADSAELDRVIGRGLYVALNGIMTFTKDQDQLTMAKSVPQDRLLLETDAPFLTPKPFRGNICKPEHVIVTGEFLADIRGETLEQLAIYTTENAKKLFNIE